MWRHRRFWTAFVPVLLTSPAHACQECLSAIAPTTSVFNNASINISLGGSDLLLGGPLIPLVKYPKALSQPVQGLLGGLGDSTRVIRELGDATLTSFYNSAGDVVRTLEKSNGDVIATVRKAGEDTVRTTYTVANDAAATYVRSWQDVGEQGRRSFDDAVDAGEAAGQFLENQAKSELDIFDSAVKRVQDGKVIDAMWEVGTEQLRANEENFAKATQQSSLINSAAASVAAAYGGPAGAAAFAAWSTYRQTGNADLALRAGLLAAATSQQGSTVAQLPAGSVGEVVKKAAIAGAAGGIAVAAAGGDEQAIKDGFLRSSGAVLIQRGTDEFKAYSPNAQDAYNAVQCISARDVDCLSKTTWVKERGKIVYDTYGKPIVNDMRIDPAKYVGKWSAIDPKSAQGEVDALIAQASKLPKMEAIPLLKNKWVLTWNFGKQENINYAYPVAVLTYVGESPPFNFEVDYESLGKRPAEIRKKKRETSVNDVVYYFKPADRGRVAKALEKKSIKYSLNFFVGPRHKAALSNALICGPNTRGDHLRRVAYALVEGGVDIKFIGTNSGYKAGSISIINLHNKEYTVNYPNITLEQLKNLKKCPVELKNR